jgi:hypothetical protein
MAKVNAIGLDRDTGVQRLIENGDTIISNQYITNSKQIKVGIVSGYANGAQGVENKTTATRENDLGFIFDYDSKYRTYTNYHPTAGISSGFGDSDGLTAASRLAKYKEDTDSVFAAGKELYYNLEFFTSAPAPQTPNWIAIRDSISNGVGRTNIANTTTEYYVSLINLLECMKQSGEPVTLAVCHEANLGGGQYPWAPVLAPNFVGGTFDLVGYKQLFVDVYNIIKNRDQDKQVKVLQVLINDFPVAPVSLKQTSALDWVCQNGNILLGFDPYCFDGYLHSHARWPKILLEPLAQQCRQMAKTFILYETGCVRNQFRVRSGASTGAFNATLANQIISNPNPNAVARDLNFSVTSGSSTVTVNNGGTGWFDLTTQANTVPVLAPTVIAGQTITWTFESYLTTSEWWRAMAEAITTDYADVVTGVTFFNGYGVQTLPGRQYTYDYSDITKLAMIEAFGRIRNGSTGTARKVSEYNRLNLQDSESIGSTIIYNSSGTVSLSTTPTGINNIALFPKEARDTVSAEAKYYTLTKTNDTVNGLWSAASMDLDCFFQLHTDLPYTFGAHMRLNPSSPTNLEVIKVDFLNSSFGGSCESMYITLTKDWALCKGYFVGNQTSPGFTNKLRFQVGKIDNQVRIDFLRPCINTGFNYCNEFKSKQYSTHTVNSLGGSINNSSSAGFSWLAVNGQNRNIVRYNLNENKRSSFEGTLCFSIDTSAVGYVPPAGVIRLNHNIKFADTNQGVIKPTGRGIVKWNQTINNGLVVTVDEWYAVTIVGVPGQNYAEIYRNNSSTGKLERMTWAMLPVTANPGQVVTPSLEIEWSLDAEVR